MKTKLSVAAGIGGCLLLIAYFNPYVLFSSNPAEQSRKDIMKSQGLLNYEKSNIPGLEIKTPAKIAIVNKLAVAKMKKAARKEKALTRNNRSNALLASNEKSKAVKSRDDQQQLSASGVNTENSFDELDNSKSDIHPYVAGKTGDGAGSFSTPLVNMPKPGSLHKEHSGRTVINYSTNDYVENTSLNKFPHEAEAPVSAAPAREENLTRVSVAEKSEKMYAFRGKTTVKSSLYKYIPPFWDGFSEETGANKVDYNLLMTKARQLAKLAAKNGYNTEFAFLADMSVKSNKYRFFVVNLRTLSVEMSALVAQGRGKERLNLDKDYSNTPGSNCSSLGLYKVGKPYEGDFGRSYRLYGMESSNNNALQRSIVLHAMGSIPNTETNFPIWQSEGCPSVSTSMLEKLGDMIDGSRKPVLMLMYDDTYIPLANKKGISPAVITGS